MFAFSKFGSWYITCLTTYPLLTKASTTASIGLLGDAAAQYHDEQLRLGTKDENSSRQNNNAAATSFFFLRRYDTRRGLANIANNIFLTTPIYHFGYEWLERVLPIYSDDTTNKLMAALGQVVIDCILFDALFVFLMFISSMTIEGRHQQLHSTNGTPRRSFAKHFMKSLQINLPPAIYASWQTSIYMIPIEYILFRYFPLHLRVLGMNLIDLIWEAVVSFTLHDDRKTTDGEKEKKKVKAGGGISSFCKRLTTGGSSSSCKSTPISTPCESIDELGGGDNKSKLE